MFALFSAVPLLRSNVYKVCECSTLMAMRIKEELVLRGASRFILIHQRCCDLQTGISYSTF